MLFSNDNIIQDIKKAFKELQTIPILREFLLIISYTNGLFSIVSIIPLLFLSFIYQNIWSCFFVLFLLSIMGGNINPKFYGFLMSNLPIEKIGILSSIGTIIQLGIIISQILFLLLIIYIPTTLVCYFYLTLSLLLIFYIVLPLLKSKGS